MMMFLARPLLISSATSSTVGTSSGPSSNGPRLLLLVDDSAMAAGVIVCGWCGAPVDELGCLLKERPMASPTAGPPLRASRPLRLRTKTQGYSSYRPSLRIKLARRLLPLRRLVIRPGTCPPPRFLFASGFGPDKGSGACMPMIARSPHRRNQYQYAHPALCSSMRRETRERKELSLLSTVRGRAGCEMVANSAQDYAP